MKNLKFGILPVLLSLLFVLTSATEAGKEKERIGNATNVLHAFAKMKESIPSQLIQQAEGIIIIPKLLNAGFGIGGKRGRGVAMIKTTAGWSNPVFVTFTGGSVGLQIGVQAVDLVLVFKHKSVLDKVQNGDFTIGGDASAAAGPVGRSTTASTDYKLDAEIYSYSRSKGLFAGISINGSNISIDKSANANFYGSGTSSRKIFTNSESTSAEVTALKQALSAM